MSLLQQVWTVPHYIAGAKLPRMNFNGKDIIVIWVITLSQFFLVEYKQWLQVMITYQVILYTI